MNGTLERAWLYADQLNPVVELDGSGAVVSRFVYGTRPNVPDYLVRGGATYRILSDHLGTPRLVVDTATGTVAQRLDVDEFGQVTADSNPGFQPFGFAGGLYDADAGLVRFGARDVDPGVGRWTARDPIRFLGGQPNLYVYSDGDPLNLVDPTGRNAGPYGLGQGPYGQSNRVAQNAARPIGDAVADAAQAAGNAAQCVGAVVSGALAQGTGPFDPVGNFATAGSLTLAGAGTFGASAAPFWGIAAAGAPGTVGATGIFAASAATAALAAAGFYATAVGTTAFIDAINSNFGTNLASFSNTPSAVQGAFPDLFAKPRGSSPGVGCGCSN